MVPARPRQQQPRRTRTRRLDGREEVPSTGRFQRQPARRQWESSRAQCCSLQTPLPTPRQLSIPPLAKEASGGRGRRSKDAHVGVCRPAPQRAAWGEQRVLWFRKLPIWERVTSPGEGSTLLGSDWVLLTALEKGRREPRGWVRPPCPPHLLCWRPGRQAKEGHQAFHGYKQPSSPGRSGGTSSSSICLQSPRTQSASRCQALSCSPLL